MNAVRPAGVGPPDRGFRYDGGPTALLLVHGLTGTPAEMRYVGRAVAGHGHTVHGVQLAGHCGSEADLLATDRRDWFASVATAFDRLRQRHRAVFVGGLSMGAVLALQLAAERPGEVAGLTLYSPTLRYDGWNISPTRLLMPLLAVPFVARRYRFPESEPYGIKDARLRRIVARQMLNGDSAAAGLASMPGPSLQELRRLVAAVKRRLPAIAAPALVLQATEDDVTSRWNADYIERRLGGRVRKVLLDDCYHMITVDRQRDEVVRETAAFIAAETAGGVGGAATLREAT